MWIGVSRPSFEFIMSFSHEGFSYPATAGKVSRCLALRRDHRDMALVGMLHIHHLRGNSSQGTITLPDCSFHSRSARGFVAGSMRSSVPVRSYVAASQDKPLRSIRPGVAGRRRAWAQATAATGNHIQAAHIPPVGENARSRSAGRSSILHRAPRQTGHYLHNDWRAGEDSRRHNPYCRNRAVQFLKEWSPLLLHGTYRQNPRPGATEQEKASREIFFGSERRKDKPQQPNRSARCPGSKEKPEQFCTVHGKLCNLPMQSHSDSLEYVRFLQ